MFIVNIRSLNADVFNESTSYHILCHYGPHGGYLKRLQSQMVDNMFHEFQIERFQLDIDLEETLSFQKKKNFIEVV